MPDVPTLPLNLRRWTILAAALLPALVPAPSFAQPYPVIGAIYPQGGQRGTTLTTTFYGANMAGATGLIFSGEPGLKGVIDDPDRPPVDLEASGGGIGLAPDPGNAVRVKIEIDAAAPLGPREARIVTPEGVSNAYKIYVGDQPELIDAEGNDQPANAQAVVFPGVVSGVINPAGDVDCYRFEGKKDQRIILDAEAGRIGSPLDPHLQLYAPDGRELAASEDAFGVDPFIAFTLPEDGAYAATIREAAYRGNAAMTYRLTAGVLPRLTSVFPYGAARGQTLDLETRGENLEGAQSLKISLDRDAAPGVREIRTRTGAGYSNPVLFEVGTRAEIMEKEPDADPATAPEFAAPAFLNGRIGEAKDKDAFRFKAELNQTLVFEVFAQRFGSPLDALLTIIDEAGGLLARNDDAAGADARIVFTAPKAGEYRAVIADLLDRGGAEYGYRVRAAAPEPNFSASYSPDSPRLRRGSTATFRVEVQRMEGFGGAVRVGFDSLPPGLSGEPVFLPPDTPSSNWITLAASEDAELGVHPLKLWAEGVLGGERVRKAAVPVREGAPTPPEIPRNPDKPVREAFIAVMEAAPFVVEPVTMSAHVLQNAAFQIEAKIRRRGGFKGPVTLTVEGYSAQRDPIGRSIGVGPTVIPAGETRGVINLTANANAETATRLVVVKGEAEVKGRTVTETGPPLPVSIYQIPFTLTNTLTRLSIMALPEGSESAAGEAVFVIKADRRGLFTEEIQLSIEGLPAGVSAETPPIARGTAESTLKIKAAPDAPAGKEVKLTVVGRASANGQNFEQRTGEILLTVEAPEPAAAAPAPAADGGKPGEGAGAGK